jgi:hypothetical protein
MGGGGGGVGWVYRGRWGGGRQRGGGGRGSIISGAMDGIGRSGMHRCKPPHGRATLCMRVVHNGEAGQTRRFSCMQRVRGKDTQARARCVWRGA